MSVLILDDDVIDRMSLERFCKKNNIQFFSASNGADALKVLKMHEINLVFSDIDMPEMNGIEFVKKYKSDCKKFKGDIPIIAVSGNEELALGQKYKDYGFDFFISKPPLPDQLMYVYSRFIKSGH